MTNLTWFVFFDFLTVIMALYWANTGYFINHVRPFDIKIFINFLQLTKSIDTSSALARKGLDIQGIPWDRLNISREKYRLTRLEQYKNYENIPSSGAAVDKV